MLCTKTRSALYQHPGQVLQNTCQRASVSSNQPEQVPAEELTQDSQKFHLLNCGEGGTQAPDRSRGGDYLPWGIGVVPNVYTYWGCGSERADMCVRNNFCLHRTQTCNNTLRGKTWVVQNTSRKCRATPSFGQGGPRNPCLSRGGAEGSSLHVGFSVGMLSPWKQFFLPRRAPSTTAHSGLNLPYQGANHSMCGGAK